MAQAPWKQKTHWEKTNASKNSQATSGASAAASRTPWQEAAMQGPHDNLPFSMWTSGTPATAAQTGRALRTSVGTAGSNFLASQQAVALPQGLARGRLREAYPSLRGGVSPFRLYFMYNPAEIQHVYSFDSGAVPAAFETLDDYKIPNFTQGASLGFALLFDRVYEVWRGDPSVIQGRRGPGAIGTLWDVQALDRLMGVYHDPTNGRPLGPAIGYPIVASFGAQGGKSIEFEGFINSAVITHVMFDANMTPTRSRIDISLTQAFLPKSGAGSSETAPPTASPPSNTPLPSSTQQPNARRIAVRTE